MYNRASYLARLPKFRRAAHLLQVRPHAIRICRKVIRRSQDRSRSSFPEASSSSWVLGAVTCNWQGLKSLSRVPTVDGRDIMWGFRGELGLISNHLPKRFSRLPHYSGWVRTKNWRLEGWSGKKMQWNDDGKECDLSTRAFEGCAVGAQCSVAQKM